VFHAVEHHVAHLASAFYVSPFEEAAVVSLDGFGDFSSAAWGVGLGKNLIVQGRVFFPHSLGIFYQALTQFLGFPHYGDEYKVMGLAPYGEPSLLKDMRRLVKLNVAGGFELDLAYFRHHRGRVEFQWTDGSPEIADLFSPALEQLLGSRRQATDPLENRHRDLARSVQAMYEEAFFNLVGALQESSGLSNLALAGGCAMNSVANGRCAASATSGKCTCNRLRVMQVEQLGLRMPSGIGSVLHVHSSWIMPIGGRISGLAR